jgi:prepilin-type N-terminal cleavage/methylation domain-containing protein
LNLRRAIRGGERGFSLVESLVVSTLSLVVLGATLAPMVTTQRAEVRAALWQDQVQLGAAQEAHMIREVRAAYSIVGTTPNSIDFLISVAGTRVQVAYECDLAEASPSTYRRCVRVQAAVGGALPAFSTGTTIVTHVLNGTPVDPVFTFTPTGFNPTYVKVHLEFPSGSGSAYGLAHPIVLDDGAYLRNAAVTT